MKIRVIGSKDEIAQLDPRERVVHLAVPLTALLLLEPMFKSSRRLLEVQGVKVFPGSVWGHRTDMYAYYTVDDGVIFQRAGELQAEGLDSEEVVARVAAEAKVSLGLVCFILKQ